MCLLLSLLTTSSSSFSCPIDPAYGNGSCLRRSSYPQHWLRRERFTSADGPCFTRPELYSGDPVCFVQEAPGGGDGGGVAQLIAAPCDCSAEGCGCARGYRLHTVACVDEVLLPKDENKKKKRKL